MTGRRPARFLFLALLPPPVHGISVISGLVLSLLRGLDGQFRVEIHDVGQANDLADMGSRRLYKAIRLLTVCATLLLSRLWQGKAAIAYASLSPFGVARLRDAIIIAVARHVSARCLVHVHAQGLARIMAGGTLLDRLLRWCVKDTELLVVTEQTRRAAQSRPSHFRQVWPLPNAIPDPGPPGITRTPGPPRIIMIANLDRAKGVPEFIQALALLKGWGLTFEAVLIGPGTPQMSMKAAELLRHQAGLEDCLSLPGALYGADKQAALAAADLFAYPSRHDLAPLVILEAMAAGTVPVAGDTGGIAEMMGEGLAGNVIATDGGTDAIAARLADRLQQLMQDPILLQQQGQAARDRYEAEFTIPHFHARLATILDVPHR